LNDKKDIYLEFLKKIDLKCDRTDTSVQKVNKKVQEVDKKVELASQKTDYELKRIHDQDETQNKLIDEHIKGIKSVKVMHEKHVNDANKRFERLEAPRIWFSTTIDIMLKVCGGLGIIAGAIYAVSKLGVF